MQNITNKPMELQKAVDILMENHRYKLNKIQTVSFTEQELNTARNTLIHYNNVQRNKKTA